MYDYKSTVNIDPQLFPRSVAETLDVIVAQDPLFISLFPQVATVAGTEYEYTGDLVFATQAPYTSATATGVFTMQSEEYAKKFEVGDEVTILGSSVILKITGIEGDAVTTSFVAANGSGLTASTIPTGSGTLRFVTHAYEENSKDHKKVWRNSDFNSNYTQIVAKEFELSDSLLKADTYTRENGFASQAQNALLEMKRELNHIAIFGKRAKRVKDGDPGHCGGLYDFGCQADSPFVDATVSSNPTAISEKLLNDAMERVFETGASPNLIICNPKQRRVISKLSCAELNRDENSRVRGSYVDGVICGLNGRVLNVFGDYSIPETDVWVVDTSGFGLVPYNQRWGLIDMKSRGVDQDGWRWQILSEFTLVFRNPTARLCRIKNLKKADEALAALN